MKIIQFLFITSGSILLFLFLLPLFFSVNLNIGSLTGIVVSVILILLSWMLPVLAQRLPFWWIHPVKKWLLRLLLSLALLLLGLVFAETACMIRAACTKPAEDATVVMLGCRVYGERPSLSLTERMDAAYDYLAEHPKASCVLSGGQGDGENISEAECMYRYLTKRGIAPERLYKEESSTSTRENLEYSMKVIFEEGLNPEIALATSEYHQYRAGMIARSLGIKYGAVSGKTAPWLLPTYYMRELYGILYEWIF